MDNEKKYFAFISYKREDEEWAKWLQHKLEHYKLPSNLNGKTDLPKEIRPIFRDKSELAGGVLADEIQSALEASKYLIVICSPRAAQSQWVGKEVQSFIDMGRTDRIIPFIIGGTAHAQNLNEECFPSALLNLPPEQELLAININEMGRDAAAVKVVAQMFGLKFDTLWQRYERERKRRRKWITVSIIAAFLALSGIAIWMYIQRQKTMEANWKMMENQSRFVAEKARDLIDKGDSYTAQRLLLEVLPLNFKNLDRPFTAEAKEAFVRAYTKNNAIWEGHWNTVTAVSFSRRGDTLLSSGDTTIRLWDARSGKELKVLNNSTGWVFDAEFSPDGKYIVTACVSVFTTALSGIDGNDIIIWDLKEGKKKQTFYGHEDGVHVAKYNPQGDKILSASLDGTIRLWDANNGCQITTLCDLKPEKNWVNTVCYSPDGKYIIAALGDGSIKMWEDDSWELVKTFVGHKSEVYSACFSPDCKSIVSASSDSTIRIWNVEKGENIVLEKKQFQGKHSACYSPDGKYIVSISEDKTIKVWDANGQEILSINTNDIGRSMINNASLPMGISPDGKYLLYNLDDNQIRIEKIKYGDEIRSFYDEHPSGIEVVALSPDERLVASAHAEGVIKLWDAVSGKKFLDFIGHDGWVNTIAFSNDGKMFVTASGDGTVKIWDSTTGKLLKTFTHEYAATSAFFSKDDKQIVSSSYDKNVVVWDIGSGKPISVYGHPTIIHYSVFSPDNRYIAVSFQDGLKRDGLVNIWDRNNDTVVKTLRGHKDDITSLCYSPDGEFLATSSGDNTIKIWDLKTGEAIRTFSGHTLRVNQVCFSHDGNSLVSSSEDGTIRIWNVHTGDNVRTYEANDRSYVNSAICNRAGSRIFSGSSDGYVKEWIFETVEDLIGQTRERFKDYPLTPEERYQYYLE